MGEDWNSLGRATRKSERGRGCAVETMAIGKNTSVRVGMTPPAGVKRKVGGKGDYQGLRNKAEGNGGTAKWRVRAARR